MYPSQCTCMHPQMQFKRSWMRKRTGAYFTTVRALSGVHAHMDCQLTSLIESKKKLNIFLNNENSFENNCQNSLSFNFNKITNYNWNSLKIYILDPPIQP